MFPELNCSAGHCGPGHFHTHREPASECAGIILNHGHEDILALCRIFPNSTCRCGAPIHAGFCRRQLDEHGLLDDADLAENPCRVSASKRASHRSSHPVTHSHGGWCGARDFILPRCPSSTLRLKVDPTPTDNHLFDAFLCGIRQAGGAGAVFRTRPTLSARIHAQRARGAAQI